MNFENKEFIFAEFGVSGREEKVREKIESFITSHVDEIHSEVTGSLICLKRGAGRKKKKVMLTAHMDTIGFVITYIDEAGFLRFSEVGVHRDAFLLGKRVIFANGTIGVIGVERKEYEKKLNKEKMFIDIGARDITGALKEVNIGDMCAVYAPYTLTKSIVTGGWMDDRVGCYILLEVIENLKKTKHDIIFVFSAQEEVGLRGARTAAYTVKPDIGLVVDVTESSDLPEGELVGSCVMGRGAGIKLMDKSVIVPKKFSDYLIALAEKNRIPFQRDIMSGGGTGAQSIQLSRGGVIVGGISVPVRYIHSAGEMCTLHDIHACVHLVKAFCEDEVSI